MINNMFITPLVQMPTIAELGGSAKYSGIDVKTDDSEMSFADTLGKKIAEIKSLEQKSLDSAYAVAMGQTEDIEGAMIDATKASVVYTLRKFVKRPQNTKSGFVVYKNETEIVVN